MSEAAKYRYQMGDVHGIRIPTTSVVNTQLVIAPLCSITLYALLFVLFCNELTTFSQRYVFYAVNINWFKTAFGASLVTIGAVFLPKTVKPQSLFFIAIYLLMVIPRFVLFGAQDKDWGYPLLCFAMFWIAVAMGNGLKPMTSKHILSDRTASTLIKLLPVAVTVLSLLTIAYLFSMKGIPSLAAFDFNETYELRAQNSFSSMGSTLINLVGVNLIPLLLVFCLSQGYKKLSISLTLLELVLFLWTANKSWLLILLLVWGTFFILRRSQTVRPLFIAVVVFYAFILLYATVFDDEIEKWLVTLAVRRLVILPSGLGYAYYEFFQSNPIVLLGGTVLSRLTPLPDTYTLYSYPLQIGLMYTGSSYANTGLFGAEFANFGLAGWFAVAINIAIVSKLISCEKDAETYSFMVLVGLLYAFELLNYSSVTLLFSLRGLIAIAVLLLLKRFIEMRSNKALSTGCLDECD